MTPRAVGVVGRHNAGKTRLVELLLAALRARGVRCATIKHARGGFELDRPGSDTWRHAQAGSEVVVVVGPSGYALIDRRGREPSLAEALALLPEEIDLVIVEGWKGSSLPKIEVRGDAQAPVLGQGDEGVLAVVSGEITSAAVCRVLARLEEAGLVSAGRELP